MNEGIFRKKSLERIKSPESMDDYIQVSNPSVWLLLMSIIVLLAGACVWGIFGHIDSTVDTSIQVQNEMVICSVDRQSISNLQKGMIVRFDGYEATISEIQQIEGSYICALNSNESIPDGFYEGKIVVSSISPVSFITN